MFSKTDSTVSRHRSFIYSIPLNTIRRHRPAMGLLRRVTSANARAQKMKRDKRSKDMKRGVEHSSKSDTKPACVIAPQEVLASAQRNDGTMGKTFSKETAGESKEVNQFANLKRETDEINAINKSFSKRQITSNWSKYETPLPPEDDDSVLKGADFESLLGAPISEGGHFKFKSEQMWAPSTLQFSDIFSLDVKHLARSLSCIPFYEQISLPQQLFSQEELQQIDNEAKQNLDRLKTSPDELFVDNFYNVLKSSLVDSSPKETIDKKVNVKVESEAKMSSGGIPGLYARNLMATPGAQGEEDSNNITCTVEDINLGPSSKEDQCERSNEENILVSLPQRQEPAIGETGASKEVEPNKSLCDSKDGQVLGKSEEDDELDFLLSLNTPVSCRKYAGKVSPDSVAAPALEDIPDGDLGALSLPGGAEKKEDLEDWLDSMLDD